MTPPPVHRSAIHRFARRNGPTVVERTFALLFTLLIVSLAVMGAKGCAEGLIR